MSKILTCFDLFDFSFMLFFLLGVPVELPRFEVNEDTRRSMDFDFCLTGGLRAETVRLTCFLFSTTGRIAILLSRDKVEVSMLFLLSRCYRIESLSSNLLFIFVNEGLC